MSVTEAWECPRMPKADHRNMWVTNTMFNRNKHCEHKSYEQKHPANNAFTTPPTTSETTSTSVWKNIDPHFPNHPPNMAPQIPNIITLLTKINKSQTSDPTSWCCFHILLSNARKVLVGMNCRSFLLCFDSSALWWQSGHMFSEKNTKL